MSQGTAPAASSPFGGFFKPLAVGKPRRSSHFPPQRWQWCEPWLLGAGRMSSPQLQWWETLGAWRLQDAATFRRPHSVLLHGVAFVSGLNRIELICSLALQSSSAFRLRLGTAGGRWCACDGEAVPRHKLPETFGQAS